MDLARKAGPYLRSTKGMGAIITAIHPSNVPAQRGVSLSNILEAKRGKTAPNNERTMIVAANADAAEAR